MKPKKLLSLITVSAVFASLISAPAAEISEGAYELTYTESVPDETELYDASASGVLLNHPMATADDVSAVADGYINRVDGNDDKRVVSYSDGAMKYTTTGLYTSSGFKYDVTELINGVISEYGADTEFTLSMDIKGEAGNNGTPAMGFMQTGGATPRTELRGVISTDKFTSVTCRTVLSGDKQTYMYLYTGSPTLYVKNVLMSFGGEESEPTAEPTADPDGGPELTLPNLFAEGMVLQRGDSAVYGRGTAGEEYTAILSDGVTEYSASATADGDGMFRASIADAPASNDPYTLTVKAGGVSKSVGEVYVGDVYLLAGQSNMELSLGNAGYYYRTWNGGVDYAEEIITELSGLASEDKRIKYIRPTGAGGGEAGFDVGFDGSAWTDCETNNRLLSVIGMLTADKLLRDGAADYPIGLISSAVGGSSISSWRSGGTNFEARIKPFCGYGISGILWYQGEQDSRYENSAAAYRDNFVSLIDSWRGIFGYDTPFVYMSLANYKSDDETAMYDFEDIRNAQRAALDKINNPHNAALIMTMDTPTTPINQIHPNGKDKVAERAARALEAMNYDFDCTAADYSGPLAERAELIGGRAVISFRNDSVSELVLKSGGGFELAGADGVYKPASASLTDGGKIILTSEVADAVRVRYAYGCQPELTVFNANGIPASPFEINVTAKAATPVEIVGTYNDDKSVGVTVTGGYDGTVIAALYGKDGALLGAAARTADEGSLQARTITFDKSENTEGGAIKVFNWDMSDMLPKSGVQERTVAEITGETVASTDSFLYGTLSAASDVTGEMAYEHEMPYRYYLPENYDSTKKYPLVMYLHGAGRTGADNEAQLQNAKYLFEELLSDENRAKYPCIMVAPQCPKNEKWVDRNWGDGSYSLKDTPASDEITMARDIIYELEDKFAVDTDRVYLAGQSMGGFGAWNLALNNPNMFAALIPLCGGASPEDAARLADTNMSIQVFHGDADNTVPVSASREMVSAVKAAGSDNIRYTEYDGEGHEVQTRAFKEAGVIDKMFASKLSENKSVNDSNVVDLAIFMGQSNMAGRGNAAESTVCAEGHGYEFRAVSDPSGLYDISEPFGLNENREGAINDGTKKTGSMVSAFAEGYYAAAHTPLVAVSASEGGTRAELWQPDTARYNDAVSRYNAAREYLEANGYYIRRAFMVWCQGESDGDSNTSAEDYKTLTMNIINGMMSDTGIERCFMIGIGHRRANSDLEDSAYDYLIQAQEELCKDEARVDMAASFKFWRTHMKDAYHYRQEVYNAVGARAGANAGKF